ncbi:uncharacterized protein [Venturia canescens]|uniref:uncharacterized protein n=1 Tax=Venturia canescens TaxID=32260 RepID=UPI001C9C7EE5|nr:uncharacterized protein LOC122412229 [Venturia canescens]
MDGERSSCPKNLVILPSAPLITMSSNALKFTLWISLGFPIVTGKSADHLCPGPLKYYEELGCTPEYKNRGDCCPEKYNCDHLKTLPRDKCVIDGHVYEIGERIRDEHSHPCDVDCHCDMSDRGPMFSCTFLDCFDDLIPSDCYVKKNATSCCGFPVVCPKNDAKRAICIVDGKTYRDGEYFKPAAEPHKSCYCGEGYKGWNVEPFCITLKHTCGIMLHHAIEIRENCVPTYYHDQAPQTDCSFAYRCQNDQDFVIPRASPRAQGQTRPVPSDVANSDLNCTFGNLTMRIGDELSRGTGYSSICMKCVCEVPPIPTCQRLSDKNCDI